MWRILALAPLMAVLALGNAYAGGEKKDDDKPKKKKDFKFDPGKIFDEIDKNDDKKISEEEWLDHGKGVGVTDEKRKEMLHKLYTAESFKDADTNGDHFVSLDEFRHHWEGMFKGKKKKDRDD